MKLNVIWATLAGGITIMVCGFLIYVIIFPDLFTDMGMNSDLMKESPEMVMIFLGNVAAALLLAHVFSRWAGITTFLSGAKAGAIFGILIALYSGLIQFGTTTISSSLTPYLIDAVFSAILWGLGGGIVGLVLGKTGSTD